MTGRRPTPTHLRLVRGNPGKRPTNEACEPQPERITDAAPPAHLTTHAADVWRRLLPVVTGMGVLTVADQTAFERLCEAYGDVRTHSATIAALGTTVYETRNIHDGFMRRPHPEVAQLAEADKRLRGYLSDFGLTPAARSKVSVKMTEHDPLDRYFG